MNIVMVKKILADGSPCKKCGEVLAKMEADDQLKFIDEILIADERGCKCFCRGANCKGGIGVHRFRLARFEHAVALRENLIALGNRDRPARDVPCSECF